MIANKIHGVYAAVCQDPFCAGLARSHSNTNALCLGGKIIGSAIALDIVRVWMMTDYLGGPGGEEKYRRRVDKVVAIDDRHLRALTESSWTWPYRWTGRPTPDLPSAFGCARVSEARHLVPPPGSARSPRFAAATGSDAPALRGTVDW